jgi:three-Cys-motif partner protein
MPEIRASDGLRARENGDYAEAKLGFLDHYVPTALDATARKVRRGYVDLFSGPGMNVPRRGGPEFEGAALRVLRMHGRLETQTSFTDAVFVNLNRLDHLALQKRVARVVAAGDARVPPQNMIVERADANECIPRVIDRFHKLDYLLVFADCEAPRQWPWTSVQALSQRGHTSVDLYMLFPLEMGINRLLAYSPEQREQYGSVVTRFFGTESWREIVNFRRTEADSAMCRHRLEELYLEQLRRQWTYARKVADVRLRGRQGLYRMLFASNHEAGDKIASWAQDRAEKRQQLTLGF